MDEDTINKFKASIDRQFDTLKDQQTTRKQAFEKQRKEGTDGGDYMFTLPMPYQPEFASPERVQYPIDRAQQNRYWRLFYKLDPVISNVIDLFGDIISSEFSIEGEGVDGDIKDVYETMTDNTKVISMFSYFIREFLVMGEVFPHLIFDKNKGLWTGLIFHNPDQIKVIDSPFIEMEPLVEFVPDASLKALINSKNPQIQKYISNLPAEVTQAISSRRNITLDTSLNVTFLARKLHPYDVRGTSILTRLYRILMYEDAISNASIATARRHAGPLKIVKLGDKELNWVPEKEYEDKILQLLSVAEQDPHAVLVVPWFVQFEAFGTTDRMLTIRNEWDVIERIKLTALGVSQGFLHGECFIFDTPVLTSDYIYKPIQDIKIGDKVIDKKGHIQAVTNAWKSTTPDTLVEIKLLGGTTLISTQNHKFPVWSWMRNCGCGCGQEVKSGQLYKQGHYAKINKQELISVEGVGEIEGSRLKGILKSYNPYNKLEASQIHPYDYLMIPRKFDEIKPKNITLDHAKLLGFYVAEGSYDEINGYNTLSWCFNLKEKDTYAKEIVDSGNNLGMDFFVKERKKGNTCVVQTGKQSYQSFYDWILSNGGRYSHGMQLSSDVMRWPLTYKEELIRAMFKGDGSKSLLIKYDKRVSKKYKCFVVQYGTVSKVLADQIQLILAQLGVVAIIDKREKSKIGKHDWYHIKCYSIYAQKLAKLVWGEDAVIGKQTRTKFWVDKNYVYVPVKSVKVIENKNKIPVYNLTVDGDHSYCVDGGIGTYNSTYSCFVEGTPVILPDGTQKRIEDVCINDKVLDKDGKIQIVENAWIDETFETIRFTAHGGFTFECTPNHEWPVFTYPRICQCGCGTKVKNRKSFAKGHHINNGKLVKKDDWVCFGSSYQYSKYSSRKFLKLYNPHKKLKASEIQVNDFLKLPRTFDEIKTTISKKQARLLGYYVAEGFKCKVTEGKYGIGWAFNINEKDTLGKDVIDICKVLGIETTANAVKSNKYHDRRNVYDIRFRRVGYHDFACWFLEHGGEYAKTKKVSEEVMRWPLKLKKELIKGYFRGDGHYSFSNTGWKVFVSSASKQLIKQIQLILAQLGIFASYSAYNRINRGSVEYCLRITGKFAKDLIAMVWERHVEVSKINSRAWLDKNYIYVPIIKIEKGNEYKKVYNLTVGGTHSYLVDNIAVFNSMKGNMQTLFMKLRGLRTFFETLWWYPKFFKPVAEMNEFIKPSQAEVTHKLRFRRSKKELLEDNRYIIPKIRWARALDPKVDAELLDAYEQLMTRLKFPIAAGTAYSAVGLDFEAQVTQQITEKQKEAELRRTLGAPKEEEEIPTETPLEEAIEEEVVEELESAPEEAEASKKSVFNTNEIYDLDSLLKTGEAEEDIWRDFISRPKKDKKNNGKGKEQKLEITKSFNWDDIGEYLDDRGYTKDEILDLKKAVRKLNEHKEFFVGEGNKLHI